MGEFLLVTIQVDMHDRLAVTLQDDLTARIAETGARGVLIDISALEIVDYKTNRPPPADAAHVAEAYLFQLAAYRLGVARVFPGIPVRAAILWTDGPKIGRASCRERVSSPV